MKKSIFLVLIFGVFFTSKLLSQNKSISMSFGEFSSDLRYVWKSKVDIQNIDGLSESNFNYSISLNCPIYKNIFLKTEIGNYATSYFVDIKFEDYGDYEWIGWYENEKIGLSILPEFKFLKNNFAYINAGFVFLHDLNNRFINGGQSSNYNGNYYYEDFRNMQGEVKNNTIDFAMNLGINPRYKDIGFLLNFGYTFLGTTEIYKERPKIKISQFGIKYGVSYFFN